MRSEGGKDISTTDNCPKMGQMKMKQYYCCIMYILIVNVSKHRPIKTNTNVRD